MAGPIRQPIPLDNLTKYIDQNVPEIKTPVDVKQFGFGQSNPTYQLIDREGKKYVMRKKPPGQLLSKTAHQVDREYRVIHALENTDVPVPKAYSLCEDDSVIGSAFYIMEFLDGRIFVDASIPGVTPEERTEMWHDAVRTLAKYHRLDIARLGMSSFGRAHGFYDRQIKTFSTIAIPQSEAKDKDTGIPVGQIPHFDDMVAFFKNKDTQPRDRGTLIHGDYKIDNMVFHKTEPRVIGVLDWEMATIGHPLSDLVNLTSPYTSTTKSVDGTGSSKGTPEFVPGATPGLPTRAQCVAWYAEVAGWDPSEDLPWGDAFGGFRGSVIMQGIAARYALRQASSAKAQEYGVQMRPYAEWTWSVVDKLKREGKPKESLLDKVPEKAKL